MTAEEKDLCRLSYKHTSADVAVIDFHDDDGKMFCKLCSLPYIDYLNQLQLPCYRSVSTYCGWTAPLWLDCSLVGVSFIAPVGYTGTGAWADMTGPFWLILSSRSLEVFIRGLTITLYILSLITVLNGFKRPIY